MNRLPRCATNDRINEIIDIQPPGNCLCEQSEANFKETASPDRIVGIAVTIRVGCHINFMPKIFGRTLAVTIPLISQ